MGKDVTFRIKVSNSDTRPAEEELYLVSSPESDPLQLDTSKVCVCVDGMSSSDVQMQFNPSCQGAWNLKIINADEQELKQFKVQVRRPDQVELKGFIDVMNLIPNAYGLNVYSDGQVK